MSTVKNVLDWAAIGAAVLSVMQVMTIFLTFVSAFLSTVWLGIRLYNWWKNGRMLE